MSSTPDTAGTPDVSAATDDPFHSPHAMLGRYLRRIGESTSGQGATIDLGPSSDAVPVRDAQSPFLSVITRTTGSRQTLVDTLACLAGQTDPDFEILLMVNTTDDSNRDSVLDLIASFDTTLRERIRVDVSTEMHRVAPLNRALDLARGRYNRLIDELMDLSNQVDTVEVEIVAFRRDELDQETQEQFTAIAGAAQGDVVVDEEHQMWPFDGEYWRDELGFYRQQVTNQCGR